MRRRAALRAGAGLLAGVAVAPGCGADAPTRQDPGGATGSISLNHGHEAVVTAAQLGAGEPLQLDITGRSTHAHTLDLTADDMRRIRAGERVSRHSSDGFDDKHDHVVTFN